tara:strand:- start:129 stop:371 length:243 start_codon:yes stop_codon:yes gene_type:complete
MPCTKDPVRVYVLRLVRTVEESFKACHRVFPKPPSIKVSLIAGTTVEMSLEILLEILPQMLELSDRYPHIVDLLTLGVKP